jgi:phosphatidate cytidylyltransferase
MKRILTALVGVPILLGIIIYLPPLYLALLVSAAVIIMMIEYCSMLAKNSIKPYWALSIILVCFVMALFYFMMASLLVVFFIIPATVLLLSLIQKEDFYTILLRSSMTILGILYLGGCSGYVIALRNFNGDNQMGKQLLLLLIGIVWLTDTGAYFVGSKLGKRPLAPHISPRKTIEGALGGIIGGIAGGLIMNFMFHNFIAVIECIIISFMISIISQCGDLIESLIKRALKTKDAGSILPGHGGMMDRMDALIFAAPFMYLYFYIKVGLFYGN